MIAAVHTRLLRHPTFLGLAAGQACSNTGMWVSMFAVGLAMKAVTGSDLQLGLVALVRALPLVGFSLIGGGLADRMDRRRLLQLTQPTGAVALLLLALAFALDLPPPVLVGLMYAATFVIGAVGAFDVPALQASIPAIVGRTDLVAALGMLVLSRQVTSILGPALAGLLVGLAGYPATFAAAGLLYCAFFLTLLTTRWQSLPERRPTAGLTPMIGEGLRFALQRPLILGLLVMDFVATAFAQPNALVIIIGYDLLALEPAQIGVLASGFPAGAVAGGLALSLVGSRLAPSLRPIVIASVLYGVGVIGFGLAPGFWPALLALILMGIVDVVSETLRNTLLQLVVPDELRGRVSALMLVFVRGGPNVGQFRAGAVASLFGPVVSAVSGGILCIVGTLLIAAWVTRRVGQSPVKAWAAIIGQEHRDGAEA
ncbi:MAG: MFS transporter [Chloroflexi bacterium]|nr:MFS transporter [Chloroflexota bacterium]